MRRIWNTLTLYLTGKKRGILAAQLLVLAFMLACIAMFIAGIFDFPRYAAGHLVEFTPYAPPWTPQDFSQILAQFGLNYDGWLQYKLVSSILIALVFWGVGFLIFFRKGNDWFGMYIGSLFVLFGTFSGDPATAFSGMHPELNWFLTPLGVLAWWGLFMLLFLFPNGRFTPRWTRWIALLLLLVYAAIFWGYGDSTPPPPLILAVLALFGVGAGSQVYRYRKVSSQFERQQTKWVMFSLVITFLVLIVSLLPLVSPELLNTKSPANFLTLILPSMPSNFISLIPLSVAFAILRYRLWDIDLVIRRTLSYGAITAVLALLYLGGVTLFQQILTSLIGQNSPLAVVLSTLLVAALFTPLRRRVQTAIDRRFYRQKVDAARALEEFSVDARREVELEVLSSRLATVVQESFHPQSISIWLKKRESNR